MTIKYLKNCKFISLSIFLTVLNISIGSSIVEARTEKRLESLSNLSLDRSSANQQIIPIRQQTVIANSFDGKASWYGPGFHGRRTANGEVYNQNALTAAHPSLSFGTKVKVTNLNNGRSVIVRINDRGPYAGGRVIDLSAAAARSLEMISSGVARVKVTILGE